MAHCARLLATVASDPSSSIRDRRAQGSSLTLPMPGLFCGVAGRPDLIGKGNNRYRPPIGYRIGSEIVGSSIAVDGDDHYNRGFETGYAAGNRRAIVPEIRKADPALGAGPAPGLELSEPDQPSTRRLNLRDSPGAGVSHARERAVPRELPLRSR